MADPADLAARFKAEPSLAEFTKLAAQFQNLPGFKGHPTASLLSVYASILDARLAVVFSGSEALAVLRSVFSTPTGLSCVTSHLNACAAVEVEPYLRLIEHVLDQPHIVALLLNNAPRETVSLIAGSRLMGVVASKVEESWVGDAHAYSRWLAGQLISDEQSNATFFDRAAKLAPVTFVGEFLNNNGTLALLSEVFVQLRPAQQRFLLVHALIPVLSGRTPGQISRIFAEIHVDPMLLIDAVIHMPAGTSVVRAAVVLARERSALPLAIETVGQEWANKAVIERVSLIRQQAMTQFLIAAVTSLDSATSQRFAHSSILTSGVSNHLESTSSAVRELGTLVGEVYAKQAGLKLEFGVKYEDAWWIGVDAIDSDVRFDDATGSNTSDTQSGVSHLRSILEPASSPEPLAADADSDDDESEEETQPAFYIKDLLAYLRSEKYNEVQWALSNGSRLIARKAKFGTEVSHYTEDLLYSACALTDKYSMTNFAELRQSILNAVLEADPHAAPVAVRLFATGDWSLSQRQSLLAALVHAAHALANGGQQVTHEQLPTALHNMFIGPGEAKVLPRNSYSDPKSVSANGLGEAISSVTTVRKQINSSKKNLFSEVSSRFFYPLLAAQPPLRASSYDALVYAQWLRSLGVIAVEAYPSRHTPDMVDEMWPLLKALAVSNSGIHSETVVQEAMYSCISLIVDIGAGIIARRHASDVGPVLDALAAGISEQPSMKTQELGRVALVSLSGVAREIERRFMPS